MKSKERIKRERLKLLKLLDNCTNCKYAHGTNSNKVKENMKYCESNCINLVKMQDQILIIEQMQRRYREEKGIQSS